jgi:serine/threonine-protein kinase
MAAVARQAASSLTTAVQQPAVNGSAAISRPQSGGPISGGPISGGPISGGPISGGPISGRSYSSAPASGLPGQVSGGHPGQVSGGHPGQGSGGHPGQGSGRHPGQGLDQSRPPYPPVPRSVSGGQARGAASVPPAQQPYRNPSVPLAPQQHPRPADKPDNSGSRQVLIVLAVVLALLVLLCAGVISFLLRQGNNGALAPAGVARAGVAGVGSSAASYRLMEQVGAEPSLNYASEGRQTL